MLGSTNHFLLIIERKGFPRPPLPRTPLPRPPSQDPFSDVVILCKAFFGSFVAWQSRTPLLVCCLGPPLQLQTMDSTNLLLYAATCATLWSKWLFRTRAWVFRNLLLLCCCVSCGIRDMVVEFESRFEELRRKKGFPSCRNFFGAEFGWFVVVIGVGVRSKNPCVIVLQSGLASSCSSYGIARESDSKFQHSKPIFLIFRSRMDNSRWEGSAPTSHWRSILSDVFWGFYPISSLVAFLSFFSFGRLSDFG